MGSSLALFVTYENDSTQFNITYEGGLYVYLNKISSDARGVTMAANPPHICLGESRVGSEFGKLFFNFLNSLFKGGMS